MNESPLKFDSLSYLLSMEASTPVVSIWESTQDASIQMHPIQHSP